MHTRASAYAFAIHDGRVLLTQLAERCNNAGHWTLPGGGIDHGEQPVETVRREAVEETSLPAENLEIFLSRTYSETSDRGKYLAVQIVYKADMQGAPRVVEQGGSTAAAAWHALEDVADLPTVSLVDAALEEARSRGLVE